MAVWQTCPSSPVTASAELEESSAVRVSWVMAAQDTKAGGRVRLLKGGEVESEVEMTSDTILEREMNTDTGRTRATLTSGVHQATTSA